MMRWRVTHLAFCVFGLLVSACTVEPQSPPVAVYRPAPARPPGFVVVHQPPPPDRDDVRPPRPAGSYVWQPGHWDWNGRAYSWTPGHYVYRQARWHGWVPGHWGGPDGDEWIAGHWS